MHIHKDMNIDIEKAIDMFAAMHPWRMRMTNFLMKIRLDEGTTKVYLIGKKKNWQKVTKFSPCVSNLVQTKNV